MNKYLKKNKPIKFVAKKLGLKDKDLSLYGDYMAKINCELGKKNGNLILVTAINPTTAGEGKTTVSIGLADALSLLNKKVCLALREPSLGPVFGMKGGATGGGLSSLVPEDDINLHFTGDFHAITSANNLLCSCIDNHIYQGNSLNIDKVIFNRCLDMNDRALRNCKVGDNEREEHFVITAASEIMAILSVSKDFNDMKDRLGNIIVALNKDNKPVFAKDLGCVDAMCILLKDAIRPNLVQTKLGTPCIVHMGPFANIAHGCNSIIATKMALSRADYVVTEAGFGADLGAEKFLDFKCRIMAQKVSAVILVATCRALKLHGGVCKDEVDKENIDALKVGFENLKRHYENITNEFKLPCVIAINKFTSDTREELDTLQNLCQSIGAKNEIVDVFKMGGYGAINLAKDVISYNKPQDINYIYNLDETIEQKCNEIAKKIYHADGIILEDKAKEDLKNINDLGLNNLPVIMAKTQYSFSDNAKLLNAPTNFSITIKEFQIRSGAKFIVAILGNMLLMPALGKTPSLLNMKATYDEVNKKVDIKLK
jgi:formate--tetrahydrofolate ligase